MNPRELRIGNIFKWKSTGQISTVEEIKMYIDRYYVNSVNILDVEPIPLTEEWLLKFGFEQESIFDGAYWKRGSCLYWLPNGYWGDIGVLQIASGLAPVINAPCQYVHQLQNLIFALTGKDPELKQ